jgi:hypothetical protein
VALRAVFVKEKKGERFKNNGESNDSIREAFPVQSPLMDGMTSCFGLSL